MKGVSFFKNSNKSTRFLNWCLTSWFDWLIGLPGAPSARLHASQTWHPRPTSASWSYSLSKKSKLVWDLRRKLKRWRKLMLKSAASSVFRPHQSQPAPRKKPLPINGSESTAKTIVHEIEISYALVHDLTPMLLLRAWDHFFASRGFGESRVVANERSLSSHSLHGVFSIHQSEWSE